MDMSHLDKSCVADPLLPLLPPLFSIYWVVLLFYIKGEYDWIFVFCIIFAKMPCIHLEKTITPSSSLSVSVVEC